MTMYNIVINNKTVYERITNEEKEIALKMFKKMIEFDLLGGFRYTFDDIKVEEIYDFDN